jgi:hypothetical protein
LVAATAGKPEPRTFDAVAGDGTRKNRV